MTATEQQYDDEVTFGVAPGFFSYVMIIISSRSTKDKTHGIWSFLHLGHIWSCHPVSQLVVLCVIRRHLKDQIIQTWPIYALLTTLEMELTVTNQ